VGDTTADLTLVDAKLKEFGITESTVEERQFGIISVPFFA
jgi:hypothetical protein